MVNELKKTLQCLLLSESLIDSAMNGEKTITIREGHRDYKPGRVILACPDIYWSKQVEVESVRHTTLDQVTEQEYIDDGFVSRTDLFEGLKSFYPELDLTSNVTVIRFKQSWED